MTEDISNKTIVVLVVLTVIISILGTVVVLNEVTNADFDEQPLQEAVTLSSAQGEVKLTILPKQQGDSATGHVTLEILPK